MNTLEHLFPVSFGKGWVGRGLVLLKVFYFPFPNIDIMGGEYTHAYSSGNLGGNERQENEEQKGDLSEENRK